MILKTPASALKYVAGFLLLMCVAAQADDKSATGTWTWTAPGRNGNPGRTNTLTLKAEDMKLTGKLGAPGRNGEVRETPITDGKVDGDSISFAIVREFNGNSNTNKYSGKVTSDKITGKVEFTRDGDTQSRDWTAMRSTDAKPADAK
jgi:hypothetical protein